VVDVWKAAGPALDFYAPDLYASNFAEWCKRYHRDGNPLYMPETRGGAAGAANVFYALGEEAGLGFSPFGIDDELDEKGDLARATRNCKLAPLLLSTRAPATCMALCSTRIIRRWISPWAATRFM
jgi:hypothetical protein